MWREEALTAREEKAMISKKALFMVSTDPNADQVKAEATRSEYLHNTETPIAHTKHSLGLDKMLGEKKV
jgi:hypothetical protein